MKRKLAGRLVRRDQLGERTERQMFAILDKYYANCTWDQFQKDLSNKNRVILLEDARSGELKGFTTLRQFVTRTKEGREIAGLFSGDTIIEAEYWGQWALKTNFYKAMLIAWWENWLETGGRRPLFWFLISKGYKTYLLLANNFFEHWPRYDAILPQEQKLVIEALAEELYPGRLRAVSSQDHLGEGLVLAFEKGSPCLRESVAPITSKHLENPKIRFFQNLNPGWEQGHELCCITPISAWDLVKTISLLMSNMWLRRLGLKRRLPEAAARPSLSPISVTASAREVHEVRVAEASP